MFVICLFFDLRSSDVLLLLLLNFFEVVVFTRISFLKLFVPFVIDAGPSTTLDVFVCPAAGPFASYRSTGSSFFRGGNFRRDGEPVLFLPEASTPVQPPLCQQGVPRPPRQSFLMPWQSRTKDKSAGSSYDVEEDAEIITLGLVT